MQFSFSAAIIHMAAGISIRMYEVAEALRASLEIERKEAFTRYTPIRYVAKEDCTYDIVVQTQDGLLHLTVQQSSPAACVTYLAHHFEPETS